MNNMEASFAKNKYIELSEHGARLGLSFSSHLDLGKKIIAFDGLKRRLLILDTGSELKDTTMIDLNEVAAVVIMKSYGSINHEELNYKGLEQFLERIDLKFELIGGKETVVLPFYDCNEDEQGDLRKLEKNADNWKKMLSKMLVPRSKKMYEMNSGRLT
jgi:hypothetical protein